MKKILALCLCALLIFSLAACKGEPTDTGNNESDAPLLDCEKVYGNVIEEFHELIINPDAETEFEYGTRGVYDAAVALGEEAADSIGYVFHDINKDGKEELLIGCFETPEFAHVKNELYAAYTYDGNSTKLLFEGRSRNSYSLTNSDTVYYYGSNGAIYSIFGEYELSESGELSCKDFYFTYEKDKDWEDIGLYHNTSDEWDPKVSEELNISMDEFWEIDEALAARTIKIENALPFSTLGDDAKNDIEEILDEPSFDDALELLRKESYEASSMLDGGFEPKDGGSIKVNYEYCRIVILYRDDRDSSGEKVYNYFAVSNSGAAYIAENYDEDKWAPVNGMAMVVAGKSYEDAIFISTDNRSEEYDCFYKEAESVSTPLVGNEDPVPIIIVALKENTKISVELIDGETTELLFEKTMDVYDAVAVLAELEESNSPLRVTAEWSDGADTYKAVWYANYKDGKVEYNEYVKSVK